MPSCAQCSARMTVNDGSLMQLTSVPSPLTLARQRSDVAPSVGVVVHRDQVHVGGRRPREVGERRSPAGVSGTAAEFFFVRSLSITRPSAV